ncbi:hypothetical protein SAMN04487946_10765 [Halobellus clavatus]|jgi:hypothetical protein|uniref:Uncharacterized protein n=1 Tax=Halobellus clavatus TaxID=660517 RepID=A0A1H3HID1_9EURY|nr:hypothetical protein SAMN04487946_10765 [Halobellus clavatus]
MSDIGGGISEQYIKSIQSAIVSIPFAVVAAPLLGDDSAAWYFLGVSVLFVLYWFFLLVRV